MDGNRLHRFSKVLDTNIGNVHLSSRVLPACPKLKLSDAKPLNKTAPSNLYKAQKLLSLAHLVKQFRIFTLTISEND
jgi:membrane-bound transcription factor site-1 protease